MKILTRIADAVNPLRLPSLKTLARGLCPALLLAAALPLSSPAQTVPITSGLQLWLKADAGVTTNSGGFVTSWADQSGNGHNAIQTNTAVAPTIQLGAQNGKPTLRFPGDVTRYLDVADTGSISNLTTDVTILAVLLYDDLTGGYRCGVSKTVGNGPAPFDWWNTASANGGAANFWLGAAPDNTTYSDLVGTQAPRVGVYNLMGFDWGNGVRNEYLNNLANGTSAFTGTTADSGLPLRIGSRDDLATQLKGNFAELLIYQPALDDADRAAVIKYLQTKWNLNFVVPPTISLQTPTNGLTVAAQATVSVGIVASDPNNNGAVTLVTLRDNGTPVTTWTQPPYSVNLSMLNPGNAVLTAVAADNLGASATSAPVSITVTGAAPALTVTNGLQVWLRADAGVTTNAGGLVTSWADQSGHGNDASQGVASEAPLWLANAINGEPALDFGSNALSNNQFLELSDTGTAFTESSNFTVLVEARFADFASYRTLVCKTGSGIAAPFDWWFAPTTGIANGYYGDGSTSCSVAATEPAIAGQFGTFGLGANGTDLSLFLNLAQVGTAPITATAATVGNPLRIGQRDDMVTQMVGDISEILMYDHALSPSDQSNAVLYLSSKCGVAQAVLYDPPPTVSLTSPTGGGTFPAGTNLQVVVNASSPDYQIHDVLLLANGSPVVTLTTSPYEVWINLVTAGSVSLTAVAVDNFGVASTSAPVLLTVTATGLTAPPTNDLRVWFSADVGVQASGGSVSQWTDRSGNGNTAMAGSTSPTLVPNALNGLPVLRFVAPEYLDVPTAPSIEITGDMATYVVARFADFSSYRALWTKTKSNIPASFDWYASPNSGVPNFYRGNGTTFAALSGTAIPAGVGVIVGYEMAGTTASHWLNGLNTVTGTIATALGDGGTDALIGTRGDFVTTFDGDIAELLCFGHGLSAAERGQLLSYLGAKYGLLSARLAVLPPTVTILSPTNGASAGVSNSISIVADVTDTFYPVKQVNFLANGAMIASETNAPYSISLDLLTPGTVTLQAQAVDIWGAIGASEPTVLTITGQGAAAPPTNGLVLWLKADKGVATNSDGTVASWADQSGLGNNAVQTNSANAPILGVNAAGQHGLEFNGTNSQYLDVASSPSVVITGDISSFCAFDAADLATEHTLWSKTLNGAPFPWYFAVAAGGDMVMARGNSNGVAPVTSSGPVRAASRVVAGFTVAGSLASHFLDGEPNGSGVLGYGAFDQGTTLRIGAFDDLTNQFAGTLSELLIYNRALTGDDLLAANAYLAARNGIVLVQAAPSIPSPSPTLTITRPTATTVELSWPTAFTGFVLESATSLASPVWTPVATNPPNNQFIVGATNVTQFFRLQSQ